MHQCVLWTGIFIGSLLLASPLTARSPASTYHSKRSTVLLSSAEKQLAKAVNSRLTTINNKPILDLRLVDAARRFTERDGTARDALLDAGISDQYLIPIRYTATLDQGPLITPVESILKSDVKNAEITHYGVGITGHGQGKRIGLIFVRRGARLSRFPKQLQHGDHYLLNGSLEGHFKKPKILIATPLAKVIEATPQLQHGMFWTTLQFNQGEGRYTIEVQAEDNYGIQVLSLLEVWVGKKHAATHVPIRRVRPIPRPISSLDSAEERSLQLINKTRARYGLKEVRLSYNLRQQARIHSSEMSQKGYFGHHSPHRGSLSSRLKRGGVRHSIAAENIAISTSPELAHVELVRSPSHLRNILDPHVTHIGVGIHQRNAGPQPVLTFTQIFARLR